MGCENQVRGWVPMAFELRERFSQGDGVPARQHREIVTGVFAFLADTPAKPPRRGMEKQQ